MIISFGACQEQLIIFYHQLTESIGDTIILQETISSNPLFFFPLCFFQIGLCACTFLTNFSSALCYEPGVTRK